MAYRRKGGMMRASTFKEETHYKTEDETNPINTNVRNKSLTSSHTFTPSSSSSLAAQAIRASAIHRDSSLSSSHAGDSSPRRSKVFDAYEDESRNDSKGFWGVLARKAKAILEDDNISLQFETPARSRFHMSNTSTDSESLLHIQQLHPVPDGFTKMESPTFRKGLDKISSSLNQIGDSFEKAFEEGRNLVENKTSDIIQETRKLQIRRKESVPVGQNEGLGQPIRQHYHQMNHETQLKASRDVAMATAAKAKLLLRELKTVKADLAFAKQRCSQLEEENKVLRESREKGDNPADDDLIRLQLETLLAEKARLAHESSMYARENRFLREIVEYHQLTMQDVVYLDESSEEVTEVYPITRMLSISPPSPMSPTSPSELTTSLSSRVMVDQTFPHPYPPEELPIDSTSDAQLSTDTPEAKEQDTKLIHVVKKKDETAST
ncbi:hypothetical protein K2173_000075 [Erythroxylum novogranatense]|uniref:Uncharacterized protein n=1 Tax=Erythroxylum novogranatense TaxID=1862640 RepID=A0AAV8SNH0_9ROSI|nr:hypothetical protein K2173_000075 [Erythroxylum novogranatense]